MQLTFIRSFCFMTLLMPVLAYANNKIVLNYADKIFQGEHVLHLKRAMKHQNPDLKLHGKKLKSVLVIAKSKKNNANIRLIVGKNHTDKTLVYGREYHFEHPAAFTFDGIQIQNKWDKIRGKWLLLTNGQLKIRKIIIELSEQETGVWEQVGNLKISKREYSSGAMQIDQNIDQFRLKASKRGAQIVKAFLDFDSGLTLTLTDLEGELYPGEVKLVRLRGWRDIKQLRLIAKSSQWGKSARVVLSVHLREMRANNNNKSPSTNLRW